MRRGLIVLAVLAVTAGAARAETRPRAAILDVATDGMPVDVREQFETLIEEGLRKVGYDVVDHKTTLETIARRELGEGCTFGPCVVPIASALGARTIIDARVAAVGQSYSFVLSMLETRSGAAVAQVVGTCPVCTVSEALTKVRASIELLERQKNVAALPVPAARDAAPRRSSRALGGWLLAAGVAAAVGGGALVAWTEQDAPGWVTIGSGGTVALTGLILLVGD